MIGMNAVNEKQLAVTFGFRGKAGYLGSEKAKAEAAEIKAKKEASKKLREAAAKRMEQTRQKHMALLDVIFEFCQHEIPYTGCPNCPLSSEKLGFDVCGGVNLTTERLQKAVEVIDKNENIYITRMDFLTPND